MGFFFFNKRRPQERGSERKKVWKPNGGAGAGERCGCVRACVCVRRCQCNIQPTRLYDRDFSRHPQLSLRRITNFAVTFAGKLRSGDGIKIGVVCGGGGRGSGGGGGGGGDGDGGVSNRR